MTGTPCKLRKIQAIAPAGATLTIMRICSIVRLVRPIKPVGTASGARSARMPAGTLGQPAGHARSGLEVYPRGEAGRGAIGAPAAPLADHELRITSDDRGSWR